MNVAPSGRLLTILLFASLGACAAGVAAIAVTGAPARSVSITAAGTAAVVATFAGIVLTARRHAVRASRRHSGRELDADR